MHLVCPMLDLTDPATHSAAAHPRGGEDRREGGQLGAVADDGPGAVGLDEADLPGIDAGLGVGPAHGALLAVLAGGGEPEAASVRRRPHPAHDAVDAVAVPLGVGQPLEHHAGHALAEGDAVGVGVEGAALARRRQGVDAREQQEVLDPVVEVGAAAQHDVAAPRRQLAAGGVQRRQRGRAGGVDGQVLAAEVEAVGDAPGDDVGQQAGERVLGDLGQPLVQLGGHLPRVRRVQGPEPVGGRLVGAALGPEDDRRALAVEGPVRVARVRQRVGRHLQAEQLGRLDRRQRGGRDAVGQRVERDVGQEPAPLGRAAGAPGGGGVVPVGVEVGGDVPALRAGPR